MSRVTEILVNVRDSLSDTNGDRWSDSRLIRLLDEGQKFIARKQRVLRRTTVINLHAGSAVYELESDVYLVTRVRSADTGAVIKLRTREWMDEHVSGWEIATGLTVEYVIFDKLNPREVQVYPIPTTSDAVEFDTITPDFGVTALSTGDSVVTDFGVVASLVNNTNNTSTFNSDFGVVTEQSEIAASIVVHYIAKPTTIASVAHEDGLFDIDEVFDKALKHYIVGQCLRDDKDTQNRSLGKEELALFAIELEEAKKISASDFTQQTQYETYYNGGI